jgi:hypothetical protein
MTDTPEIAAARKAVREANAAFDAAWTRFGAASNAATDACEAALAARRRLCDLLIAANKEPTP